MKCNSCGATLGKGATFCSKCGAKVEESQKLGLKVNKDQIKDLASAITKKGGEVIKNPAWPFRKRL